MVRHHMEGPMFAQPTPLATRFDGGHRPIDALFSPGEDEIAQAARTDACILFTGPPHVRTLALRIHSESGWRWGAFGAVDCGASERTLEQQLFGVLEADLAPAAPELPAPRLRQAGTLFLHEVGHLSLHAQRRLGSLLEAKRLESRTCTRRRIMASTSSALLPRVMEGSFDDRLFYRLNVIHFVMPPLR